MILRNDECDNIYPSITPKWDNTPRKGNLGYLLHNATPELFKSHLDDAIKCVEDRPKDKRLLFLFAWNEWGEGAYMEPDLKYGRGHLQALKEKISKGGECK